MAFILTLYFLTSIAISYANRTLVFEEMQRLIEAYPAKQSMPPTDASWGEPLNVTISLSIKSFSGIDDSAETIVFSGSLRLRWTDQFIRLSNDTLSMLGTDSYYVKAAIPRKNVWSPNIGFSKDPRGVFPLFNAASPMDDKVVANLATGSMNWYPGGTFVATCELDFWRFPWDRQVCEIPLTSWTAAPSQWVFVIFSTPIFDAYYTPITTLRAKLWQVIDMSARIDPSSPYSTVVFNFQVDRMPDFYLYTILFPDSVLLLLMLAGLCHPAVPERPAYFLVLVLTFGVLETEINEIIPPSSNMCILRITLLIHTGLATLYAIESVLLLRMNHGALLAAIRDKEKVKAISKVEPIEVFTSVEQEEPEKMPEKPRKSFFLCDFFSRYFQMNDIPKVMRFCNIIDLIMFFSGIFVGVVVPVLLYALD